MDSAVASSKTRGFFQQRLGILRKKNVVLISEIWVSWVKPSSYWVKLLNQPTIVIFHVEICETDMDLTTKSWQRVLNDFLPERSSGPSLRLEIIQRMRSVCFILTYYCEWWGVKIRLIPILDLFYSLSHKLTCFWLVSVKNVGWSFSHSSVKFPRTSAVSTKCQRLTAHFLTLYWDLRRNQFWAPQTLPCRSAG